MNLEIFNDLINRVKENKTVQNFIEELSDFVNNEEIVNENSSKMYKDYWRYQKFIEDNVAANIGISRWATNITYRDELAKAIEEEILKLTESEGALYRKKYVANGDINNKIYKVDKFENGKVEHLKLSQDKVPSGFDNEDIIFQYNDNKEPKLRMDLKEKVISFASKSIEYIKEKENKKAEDYKKEAHIYEAFEDDGYIFLNDITQEREYSLEDIDFVVDKYEGEGKYQVINGEYEKVEE